MTGTDPSQYKLLSIVHDNQMYSSMNEFLDAWTEGLLVKQSPQTSAWASRAIRGESRDLDDRAGPRMVQFDGPRYRVDREEQYVTWMGWAFYIGFERDMGVHLWDMCVFSSVHCDF